MNFLSTGIIAALTFAATTIFANPGKPVPISSSRTFAPVGFDDNDQTQIVLEGRLDNDCYRLAQPRVKIDQKTKQIEIQPTADYFQWMCLEVQVPWTQTVDLGVLSAGTYQIKVGATGESEKLAIKPASTVSPDDHVYAPVDSVDVLVNPAGHSIIATLRGRFATRCAEFDEFRVIDSGKTIQVLPIVKAGSARNCSEQRETSYEQQLELPWRDAGRYLVHVRTLNGQSVNHVFEVP